MKKVIFIITLFLCNITIFAQENDNPYSMFGYEPKISDVNYSDTAQFCLYNTDTTALVQTLVFDFERGKVFLYSVDEQVLTTLPISKETIARFNTIDPLAEKYPHISPYAYCMNNPVRFIDPTGLAPIYAPDGTFLGTDDEGLRGVQLILDRDDFTQGMAHADAQKVLWAGQMTQEARAKMDEHFAGLSLRPDYDGFVSIAEGIAWAKKHPNALKNPTPDNTLYVDASKLDFGFLSTADFDNVGEIKPQDLFADNKNLAAAAINPFIAATVYALGRVDMILLDRKQRTVQIVNNNATDYDWNLGGTVKRDRFIRTHNALTKINPQIHGFKTYYYGTGRLRK